MNGNNLLKLILRDVCHSEQKFRKKLGFKISWQIDSIQHISFTGILSAEICFIDYETSLR